MKNHIKNYIKIMGLAAVPFGTAQVYGDGQEIKMHITDFRYEKLSIKVEYHCDQSSSIEQSIDFQYKKSWIPSIDDANTPSEPCALLGVVPSETHFIGFCEKDEKSDLLLYEGNKVFGCRGINGVKFSIFPSNVNSRAVSVRLDCTLYLIPVKVWNRCYDAVMSVKGVEGCRFLNIVSDIPVLCYCSSGRFCTSKLVEKMGISRKCPELYQRFTSFEVVILSNLLGDFCDSAERGLFTGSDESEESESEEEIEIEEPAEPTPTQARIKALFEADRARREKDPELEKERMRREKAAINARNRICELIRMDLESRKIKEDNKIGKNEIILKDPKFEDKKGEKLFEKNSKEDYFKGFEAFKENLSAEFKKNLKKNKSEKNEIKIGDKKSKDPEIFNSEDCFGFPESRLEFSEVVNPNPIKIEDKKEQKRKGFKQHLKDFEEEEDAKIEQSEITFGKKSLAESIYNNKSSKKSGKSNKSGDEDSVKSDDRDSISKLTLGSDFD